MTKARWVLFFLVLNVVLGSATAQGTRCSIPLTLRRGIPFVHVQVNGRGPFTFAVDSGTAREAIVSPALVKSLQLPPAGRTALLDLTGKRRQVVNEVLVRDLALPGRAFSSVRAIVHEPAGGLGAYDGVLGFALFRDTVLTLDFPGRCMRIEDGGLTAGQDPDVLPFSIPRNVPVVELTMGRERVLAQIDTGGTGINLPLAAVPRLEFAKHSEILVRAESQVSTFFLRGGVMKADLGLGSHVFRQPFVEVGESLPVGNLGALSLRDFAVTFDQERRLVRFQARSRVHRLERRQLDEAARQPERVPTELTPIPGGS